MYFYPLIFIIILIVQILVGIKSWNLKYTLKNKYSFVLGSQKEVSDLIADHINIHKNLILRATNQIDEIAISEGNYIYINKKSLYSKDLYSNIYCLFVLELSINSNKLIRNVLAILNLLFILQFVFLLLGMSLSTSNSYELVIVGIITQLLTFVFSFFALLKYHDILEIVRKKAKKILILDKVEIARVEALTNEIKYQVFEYPFDIMWRIYQFLKP